MSDCKESKDGFHGWQMIDATGSEGREKVWVCPCGAWRPVTMREGERA